MLPVATSQQLQTFETQDAAHRAKLRKRLDEAAQRNSSRGRFSMGMRSHNASGAIHEVSQWIGASERAAKARAKQAKKPAQKTTVPKRAPRREPKRATGTCGKPTRSGRPCQRSANCPVHRGEETC